MTVVTGRLSPRGSRLWLIGPGFHLVLKSVLSDPITSGPLWVQAETRSSQIANVIKIGSLRPHLDVGWAACGHILWAVGRVSGHNETTRRPSFYFEYCVLLPEFCFFFGTLIRPTTSLWVFNFFYFLIGILAPILLFYWENSLEAKQIMWDSIVCIIQLSKMAKSKVRCCLSPVNKNNKAFLIFIGGNVRVYYHVKRRSEIRSQGVHGRRTVTSG